MGLKYLYKVAIENASELEKTFSKILARHLNKENISR